MPRSRTYEVRLQPTARSVGKLGRVEDFLMMHLVDAVIRGANRVHAFVKNISGEITNGQSVWILSTQPASCTP
jgi:hypothetical protein